MIEERVLPGLQRYWFAAITGGVPVLIVYALYRAADFMAGQYGGTAALLKLAARPLALAAIQAVFVTGGFIMVGLLAIGPTMLLFAALMRGAEARAPSTRLLPAWWVGGLVAFLPLAVLPTIFVADRHHWKMTILACGVAAATLAWLVRRRWR